MLVYRVCSDEEINSIFSDYNFNNVGNYFKPSILSSHNYKKDKKYLHFFHNKDSILYLSTNNKYLCTYNIPDEILDKSKGFGNYMDYFNFTSLVATLEYAIENTEIDFEYLEQVDYIKINIDIEEYLNDNNLTKYLDIFYKKEATKKFKNIKLFYCAFFYLCYYISKYCLRGILK